MPAIVSRMSGAPACSRSARVLAPVSTPATIAAPARRPDSMSLAVSPATASSPTAPPRSLSSAVSGRSGHGRPRPASAGDSARSISPPQASLLDAKAYPEITFSGQGARRDGDSWVLPGSVTAHGTAVPAEVRLTDAREEAGAARFRATARLDRTSFGVTKKKGMAGRTVDLVIEAVAQTAPGQ